MSAVSPKVIGSKQKATPECPVRFSLGWLELSPGKLSFPAGILNFESSCGVCDSWGWARVGRRGCGGPGVMDACGGGLGVGALVGGRDCGGRAMRDACWARLVIAAL